MKKMLYRRNWKFDERRGCSFWYQKRHQNRINKECTHTMSGGQIIRGSNCVIGTLTSRWQYTTSRSQCFQERLCTHECHERDTYGSPDTEEDGERKELIPDRQRWRTQRDTTIMRSPSDSSTSRTTSIIHQTHHITRPRSTHHVSYIHMFTQPSGGDLRRVNYLSCHRAPPARRATTSSRARALRFLR